MELELPTPLAFVWAIAAEDVTTGAAALALVSGGRSAYLAQGREAAEPAECSFFVESRRGEVVVQILAELDVARVFASLRFDLARPGAADALRKLASQDSLTLHALSADGSPLGTAHLPLGVARRAWVESALLRATRAAGAS